MCEEKWVTQQGKNKHNNHKKLGYGINCYYTFIIAINRIEIIKLIKPAIIILIPNLLYFIDYVRDNIEEIANGNTIFAVTNVTWVSSDPSKPSKERKIKTPAITATLICKISIELISNRIGNFFINDGGLNEIKVGIITNADTATMLIIFPYSSIKVKGSNIVIIATFWILKLYSNGGEIGRSSTLDVYNPNARSRDKLNFPDMNKESNPLLVLWGTLIFKEINVTPLGGISNW